MPDEVQPFRARVDDLVARLTTAEKIAMLHQHAPAVERLGLRAFHTGAEVLHGVSWLGNATVFPQPVGLGATWDTELLTRVGEAVGTELRAKHAADPNVSLNVWAPVVNPLRHPAWGRNEEGYSEDPWLTGELATAYARGLRGSHPLFWRTVPTLKHAVGYNNETDRSVTSSQLRPRVLHEYELPAFLVPIEAGVVGAVMPAYNLVNGRPNHLSGDLLEALRAAADGSLLVVSDAAAPGFVVSLERFYPDHVSSHAAMLRAGIDSFTSDDENSAPTVEHVTVALEQGLIAESDIDRAVTRQLELRLATGELDPDRDPFVVAPDQIDLPEHRALAREAVARSVVVLENAGDALPLAGGSHERDMRVAVVGPMADRVLHDWYSGTPPYLVGLGTALGERLGTDQVAVADDSDRLRLRSTSTGGRVRAVGPTHVLTADGDDGADGDGDAPDTLHDLTYWGNGTFTLRDAASGLLWSGAQWVVHADSTRVGGWVAQESFRKVERDDGTWSVQHAGSGRWLRVQHDEAGTLVADAEDLAVAERFTAEVVRSGADQVRDAIDGADVVLVAVGNDPHLGGRETQDRPELTLPSSMLDLWDRTRDHELARVLVVVSSYPYVLPDDLGADAVVWSSHGGQELGHGLVDVLVGDEEPRGRLTQAWPDRTEHVGDLFDYDIITGGLTTWYARHAPRYGLGHGLTYGDVVYESVRRSQDGGLDGGHDAGGDVALTVTVRNTGDRLAHELVQVYAEAPAHRLPFGRRLVAHERVEVAPGARVEVRLRVPRARLATWDVTRSRHVIETGYYELAAGPSSTDLLHRVVVAVAGETVPPRPWCGLPVRAVDADELDGVEITAATRTRGEALQVARGRTTGSATYWTGILDGANRAIARLARTGPGEAGVTVDIAETPGWRTIATFTAPEDTDRYTWRSVTEALDGTLPASPADVRITLSGRVRLESVELSE